MRILIVIHGFPPEYMAGSEVYTYHLAKELSKSHEVFIFHRIENPFINEYELIETSYHGLNKFVLNIPYLPHYFEGRYINEKVDSIFSDLLKRIKPDLVHFGHLNYLSTNLPRITKEYSIPTIYTLHDFWLYCPRGQLINRRDDSLCNTINYNNCSQCLEEYLPEKSNEKINNRFKYIQTYVVDHIDHFIAPSNFLLEKMIELGLPREKVTYLDYGFNFEFFMDYRKMPSEKIRFGYIGRIIPAKGVHLLIDAFNLIESNNAELLIYGSSSSLEFLQKRATNPNVHFLGSYDNWDIGKVLSNIDVLIVPSIWFENSPLVIHEASIVKIPIITSNIGGMAEYVKDGINGLLFERNNSFDLKEKIESIINDPEQIDYLSNNALKVDSIEDHVKKLEEIYSLLK